jgi:hypothetical protein
MLDTSAPGQFGTCVRHFGIKTVRHPDNSALVFFSLILRTKLPIMEIQYSYSPTVKRLIDAVFKTAGSAPDAAKINIDR